MTVLIQDLRYAMRQLGKSPGFTAVAVLTLALGIGANTAIFSVVQRIVLAPLPYQQPDQLVAVWEKNLTLKRMMSVSSPDFRDWQGHVRSFQQMAALRMQEFDLTSPGTSEHVEGKETSSGLFSTLGVKFGLGRDFSAPEDRENGAPVVIISNHLWKDRFAGSSAALGNSVTLNGVDYTIVGVLPPEFHFMDDADVYIPIGQADPLVINDRTVHSIVSIARLNPGITVAQAQAEMSAVQSHLNELYPKADRGLGIHVVPLKQEIIGDVRGTLLMLWGAVGLVLLITCANVANLLMSRSAGRTREFAIRSALGANRRRLICQCLTESVLLSVAGGVLGLLVAVYGVRPLLAAVPNALPHSEDIGVNASVLQFTFGVSMLVGILFGLVPALKIWNPNLQASLNEGGRGSAGRHHRAQSGLVIVQMSLTVVLLVCAGLLFRTIRHLWQVDPGFETQNIVTFKVGLSPSLTETASSMRTAYQQLIERIRRIPGVQAADITALLPLTQTDNAGPFWAGSQEPASSAEAPRATFYWTGPDYLQTMRIELVRGRFFTPEDTTGSGHVVVIDNVLARTYFPDRDPLGQTLIIPHWGSVQVIGVVGHVRHWDLGDSNRYTQNQIYASLYQLRDEWLPLFRGDVTVAVRTPLDITILLPAIKEAVYGLDGDQPVYDVRTMQEIASESMSSQRLPMILLAGFAGLALLLASVGIYGVISYSVSQRVREIGVRMALGAGRGDVLRMVIRQGLRLALAGVAIGATATLVLTRLLSSFSHLLYGVGTSDPVTFVAVSLTLTGVAVAACYIPARRAAKADPMVALRYE